MTATYFVIKIEECPRCEGAGMIEHPAWKEYWAEHGSDTSKTIEEDRQWMQEHGWYPSSDIYFRNNGLPDEEIICPACAGEAVIETRVNLMDVLLDLLIRYFQVDLIQEKTKIAEVLNRGAIKE